MEEKNEVFSEDQTAEQIPSETEQTEKAHLYVWDEPLNFIDVYSRMQIEQLITEFAPTMLLVEHDSVFRDTVASKIVNI